MPTTKSNNLHRDNFTLVKLYLKDLKRPEIPLYMYVYVIKSSYVKQNYSYCLILNRRKEIYTELLN